MSSCEHCSAYKAEDEDHGVCRAKAPVPFVIGMQQGQVQARGQRVAKPVVASVFPETSKHGWCREFVMSEELLKIPTLPMFGEASAINGET